MKKKLLLGILVMALGASLGCSVDKKEETSQTGEVTNDTEESVEGKTIWEKVEEEKPLFVDGFSTIDIYGNTVTKDIFADYDLTLVNLFATWCGPCVSEMPHLAQLQKDMKDQGVNIVAVVMDAGVDCQVDADVAEAARELAEASEAEFTFMIPDSTLLNGYLYNVTSVPESLLVDKDGNVVGESYIGARDYDAWKEIIETALAGMQEAE